jgi:fatty-acyl-CoA synthase
VDALMMEYQLTLSAILRRAESFHGAKEIVSRLPDGSFHRSTYADLAKRSQRLAVALRTLGVAPGDRVATLCWNHHQHLEAYFGVPGCGAVVHTLNPRLSVDDLAYIAGHAGDRAIIVDQSLLPVLEGFRDRLPGLGHVVVVSPDGAAPDGAIAYEDILGSADPAAFVERDPDEREAVAMCYTSGTTGRPKGVLYSHRAIALHSLMSATVDGLSISEADTVLPVVPMFHVNAWGLPFTSALVGAKQVLPGPHLDAQSLLDAIARERVTVAAGVPTIWLGLLQALDERPDGWDLSSVKALVVGGAAAPRGMIEGFEERHGLQVLHAWGMTETTPIGTVGRLTAELREAPHDTRYAVRSKQGRAVPFVELRVRGDLGVSPADGRTMGELEIRGPWVAGAYYESPDSAERFTEDGWFRTGDIATIDEHGYMEIQDRAKDLIKSGGEWISSVALENALMGHPAIAEAAVIAVPDPKWQERPLAVVVLKEGMTATAEELRAHLAPRFASWSLPDAFELSMRVRARRRGSSRRRRSASSSRGRIVLSDTIPRVDEGPTEA